MDDCDLVMKGGITSGAVYPTAVETLKDRYRFRSIGGASGGAVAAALTAAAEYDRDGGGFDRLAAVGKDVAEDESFLGQFQPRAIVIRLARRLWPYVAGGVLFMLMLLGYLVLGFNGELRGARAWAWPVVLLFAVFTATSALALAAAWRAWRVVRGLPDADFGLSTGMPERSFDTAAFTPWLHQRIQRCAGRRPGDAVLTFGDLRGRGVNLELMTTDVTSGRTVRLPEGLRGYLFSAEVLARLFPRDVVDHVKHSAAEQNGLLALEPDDLPVVVATRMSLAFPILIAAVPVWIDASAECHWLVDGGIAFPVDGFDVSVPRWPTFGLDLAPANGIANTTDFVRHVLHSFQADPEFDDRDVETVLSGEFDWENHRIARYERLMDDLQRGVADLREASH